MSLTASFFGFDSETVYCDSLGFRVVFIFLGRGLIENGGRERVLRDGGTTAPLQRLCLLCFQ